MMSHISFGFKKPLWVHKLQQCEWGESKMGSFCLVVELLRRGSATNMVTPLVPFYLVWVTATIPLEPALPQEMEGNYQLQREFTMDTTISTLNLPYKCYIICWYLESLKLSTLGRYYSIEVFHYLFRLKLSKIIYY